MIGKIGILSVFTTVVIGAPLVGVYLSDRAVALFATFPPLTTPAVHHPFSWAVFLAYLLPLAGVAGLAGAAAGRGPSGPVSGMPLRPSRFPLWGRLALAFLAVSWVFAWTRFSWLGPWQRHSFIPLWLSYIVVANALCVRRSGTCPLLQEPVFFAALFPLLILITLRHMAGRPTLFAAMAEGDWRPVLAEAAAALVCGCFWEMWNFYSLAKWKYSNPYVHRFELFEMPVLGYMGYLPFGLLCIEITDFLRDLSPSGGKGMDSR